jgi:hypothetical protein
MTIEYRIALHARTTSGFDTFGEFFIGNDRQAAKELFNSLKGSPDDVQEGLLIMELREINRNLPFDIKMISCTLDQLSDNCPLKTTNHHLLFELGKYISIKG